MTNEQMALEIQRGNRAFLSPLWERTKRLVFMHANSYYTRYGQRLTRAGATLEDLTQEGYFAMLEAVSAYDPASGYKFTTYLRFPLQNRFHAIAGLRTFKGQNDPLTNANNLDAPVTEDGQTLADLIDDPNAQRGFDDVIEDGYRKALHMALDRTMGCLSDTQRAIIEGQFYKGLALSELGKQNALTYNQVTQLRYDALRKLRHPVNNRPLWPYRDDIIATHAYKGGFASFKHSFESSVERTVFKLEQAERRHNPEKTPH